MTTDNSGQPADGPDGRSIQEQVRRDLASFTEAERRVAQALLDEYPTAGLETVARFARRAQTSGPTILRFIARLGFENYATFQDALRAEIQIRLQSPLSRYKAGQGDNGDAAPSAVVARTLRQNIDITESNLRDVLPETVGLLSDPARNVLCIGGRFSWLIASYLHHYLREIRPSVRLVRDSSAAWADYLLDIREGDVVVVFDFRRYQRDVLDFARAAAAQKAQIILVTDVWYSPIAAFSKIVLPCPVRIPSAFDSGVSGLAAVEIVIAAVIETLDESARKRITTLERLRKPFKLGS